MTGLLVLALAVPSSVPLAAQIPPPPEQIPDPLVFAGSNDYPPFQWLDSSGEPKGFVIDLQDAIAHQPGLEAEHRLMAWDKALEAVETGEADVVALFHSEARDKRFDFTSPLYHVAHGIYAPSADSVQKDPDDLSGMRVALVEGGYAQNRLMDNQAGGELMPHQDIRSALLAVSQGRADIALVAAHTARHVIAEAELELHQVSPPFWPKAYAFAVRQGRAELHAWLEEQVGLLQANGTYFEIHADWLSKLEWQPPTWWDHLRPLAWLVLPLLLLAAAGYLWSWSLRRQVARKTHLLSRELESRRSLQGELQYRLEHDMLTGLPNRSAFIRKLDALIQAEPDWSPTVAKIQLVNLDQLITAFSHSVALELQKAFAALLEAQDFRLVGHFGSGLFAIASRKPLEGHLLVQRLTAPLNLGSADLDPVYVVGIVNEARLEKDDGADEVLRRALLAVSKAREEQRRWVSYSAELEPVPDDLRLLQDFHRHGTRDMFLEYQPKLDLETGDVQAVEALIRWKHPTLGLVPPGCFIPLLEQAGLTHRITRWVIEEVSGMLSRTGLAASGFQVSINLAPQDLMEPDLVDFIARAVAPPMPAHCLWLEITETGFIRDPSRIREVLHALRKVGYGVSVDDFGTGYSSLSYMSEFPVDEVKLDRSFVGDMLEEDRHFLIVRSTIALAHELGLTVTAEGVEDWETLRALVAMNCDTIQGYFLSRPLEEENLLAFLDKDLEGMLSGVTTSKP
ncbi:EAL domain-containing protein (putative c-di-GMP-specific phosphodiesterase class I)/ABC-type amino acid transport substrate-binding protein/GGDEF domain-containing protein [Halomonas fontilapidosi]|uniref:EAL domain-containing protein (Putative c-di-GMP-specific phosphodiesterase class I)/ABC-type amino acid transport substrate-binding protein/GGDEF domain-containing protein n=1 Tax=Halomonas fontilapidosi TaxID=616675 RepID=A0A7W5DKR1_9GAMM|nr:EAL domain-containing protein [Halomonas fontilapidosi]MBB3184691.1 EAL domain-containing protein (putative c-di-GMP-specific phosphodiesterase class I)/ABC-type amino acid transport substrate-binding protein/GGDEF domain-containing protein [Halomonas fontilapidosi]